MSRSSLSSAPVWGAVCLFAVGTFLLLPVDAAAEGSQDLDPSGNNNQPVQSDTDLFVDIVDHTQEEIEWIGTGSVDVTAPSGASVGSLSSGETLDPDENGSYKLDLAQEQSGSWEVNVLNQTKVGGRLYSKDWHINTGSYDKSAATDTSFYALVPTSKKGAQDMTTAVIELQVNGLAGFDYNIKSNSEGVTDTSGNDVEGSVPDETQYERKAEYPVYLNPPTVASYSTIQPNVENITLDSGNSGNCLTPGDTTGKVEFETDVKSEYKVLCDVNGDGQFDPDDPNEVMREGTSDVGMNTIEWDGTNKSGNELPSGEYECRVNIRSGEFHYVGRDIETSFPGMRMFLVKGPQEDADREGLPMVWDDSRVQSGAVSMPNGQVAPERSPPGGLDSGSYSDQPVPNGETGANARAWGNFQSTSKGDVTLLDTFTFAASSESSTILVQSVEKNVDSDGDSLTDFTERCKLGTDPEMKDSDGDGINDDVETDGGMKVDTDGDGVIDALDSDSDNDTLPDKKEGTKDTDGDGTPNYRDPDDDGDGIPTAREAEEGSRVGGDPDDDMKPAWLDEDSDGDGIPDETEGVDDPDADGTPNYLDTDSDGDGISDEAEGTDDADGDGTPNYLDEDSDGDGIPDRVEGDGDADENGTPNYLDEDSDGDGISDEKEGTGDPDGDGTPNYLDEDSDGDGIPDKTEGGDDYDGDGTPNYLDTDADGDGRPDADEGEGSFLQQPSESGGSGCGCGVSQQGTSPPGSALMFALFAFAGWLRRRWTAG